MHNYNLAITLLLNAEDIKLQCDFYEKVHITIVESVPGVCVDIWWQMLAEWQTKGERALNPFKASHSRMYGCFKKISSLILFTLDLSQAQVRLDLYRQDAASIQCRAVSVMGRGDTPSTIIAVGLDLEEEQ